MANATGYAKYQSISLEGEAAYEELYMRLARWTTESVSFQQAGQPAEAEAKLDRCIQVLSYMDRGIDMSQSRDIALAIMSLHRFAITTLVKAKADPASVELESLVKVFFSLAEIFDAIRVSGSKPRA
jgi:flagellin-specific chaperone FliS